MRGCPLCVMARFTALTGTGMMTLPATYGRNARSVWGPLGHPTSLSLPSEVSLSIDMGFCFQRVGAQGCSILPGSGYSQAPEVPFS